MREMESGGPLELLEKWLRHITDQAAPVILQPAHKLHMGQSHNAVGLSTGIADGGQIAMAFWNPSGTYGQEAHVRIAHSIGGQSYAFLYEGGEISATGTFIEPVNRFRSVADVNPSQWKAGFMPTVDSLGTRLRHKFIGGGTGANPNAGRDEGESISTIGWILDPEHLYLLVVLNTSGATIPGHIDIEWYEGDK